MKLLDSLEKPEHNARRQCDEYAVHAHGALAPCLVCACFCHEVFGILIGAVRGRTTGTNTANRSPAIAFMRVS